MVGVYLCLPVLPLLDSTRRFTAGLAHMSYSCVIYRTRVMTNLTLNVINDASTQDFCLTGSSSNDISALSAATCCFQVLPCISAPK